jgi:putative heme-binding domain-containing protein
LRTARAPATAPTLWSFIDYSAAPDPAADPSPKWIWGPKAATSGEDRYFRITFDPKFSTTQKSDEKVTAWIWAACDDDMTIHLNGKLVSHRNGHGQAVLADVHTVLTPGENVLAVKCHNDTGPAGIALKLEIRGPNRKPFQLVTNESWQTSHDAPDGWRNKRFKDPGKSFEPARVLGPYGMEPWGKVAAAVPAQATSVDNLALPPGFKAELVYSVPKGSQGSWVSMTPDPKGRLYVSDQNGPLYRVTPGVGDKPTQVEQVELEIGSSQGMLWAFNSLYVVVNAKDAKLPSGLYRLRDTDGDDKLDDITTLKQFKDRTNSGPGFGEHGPHAVILGPDKKLYVVAGNFTSLPDPVEQTSPAQHWAEDLLLPRMTDGKGHDPTIYAPASCISRTDENGKTWEPVAVGMRNAYDIAFNPQGELFTFDSDMEWDIGAPWWRPIRVCHVVSGAEFGWRNGSAKWPTYYADSVPPVVDIGIGSPTGVTFGYGAKFPAKYQRAFFASDWAYGKIYAVHMKPSGSGYSAEFEPFIIGKPFDVTDIVINHDGNMYITIGGRGTQSGLYRVSYTGTESTSPVKPIDDPKAAEARGLRHKLETFHGHHNSQVVSIAWPYLSHEDRLIRYAARVAIEFQDQSEWLEKAIKETNPTASANALIALSRVGNKWVQPRILSALNRPDLATLTESQLLDILRAYEVCFARMGMPSDPAMTSTISKRLEALYPHKSTDVTHELCQLLAYLNVPSVITKSMPLLKDAKTQEEQLFYVFTLRNLREGWTKPHRETYFAWLNRAQQNYTGGASYKLFLKNVREDSIKTLGESEKLALGPLLKTPVEIDASAEDSKDVKPRKVVRAWEMKDLLPKLDKLNAGRSYESGKAAFAAVSCIKCHRFNGTGGPSGPDITGVGNRFQPADLLEAIVLPSKVISDQYQATEIITRKKQVFVGTVQEENDLAIILRSSPLSTETETVPKTQIAERRPSKLSVMPQGLLDVLSENEVLDLLAYVRAAGNPEDKAFQKSAVTSGSP